MATHSKAGEDVGSSTDADPDHAVDPVEKPAVNARQHPINAYHHRSGCGSVFERVCLGVEAHSLELSHHRRQHFSQLVHSWVAVTAGKRNKTCAGVFWQPWMKNERLLANEPPPSNTICSRRRTAAREINSWAPICQRLQRAELEPTCLEREEPPPAGQERPRAPPQSAA